MNRGRLPQITVQPGQTVSIDLPQASLDTSKGGEYFLQIEAQLINEEGILEAKTPLAFGEFQLTKSESIPYAVPETNSIEITESVNQIKIITSDLN